MEKGIIYDDGDSDFHGDFVEKMWAYGRVDFGEKIISLGIILKNIPEIYSENPQEFAKRELKERYPNMRILYFGSV